MRQRRDEHGLPVLPRDVDERLMEAPDVGACFVPPDQVVDDEHLPWLQQERLVDQAVALHVFALVMDESLRDDVDDKVRIMRPEFYVRALQIIQEPLALSTFPPALTFPLTTSCAYCRTSFS